MQEAATHRRRAASLVARGALSGGLARTTLIIANRGSRRASESRTPALAIATCWSSWQPLFSLEALPCRPGLR